MAKKVNGAIVRQWTYQTQLHPLAEYDGSGNLIQQFIYATRDHVPDLIIRGGTTYRVISDQTGSVRRIVEVSSGAIVHEMTYSPFGKVLSDSSPAWQPFGFAGGHYDGASGLVRFGARDYDPEVGRWTAKDLVGFDDGPNLYTYVDGDSVNYVDPTGAWRWEIELNRREQQRENQPRYLSACATRLLQPYFSFDISRVPFTVGPMPLVSWDDAATARFGTFHIAAGLHDESVRSGLSLIAHELAHLQQERRYGKYDYLWMYAIETAVQGYDNNFEREAEELAKRVEDDLFERFGNAYVCPNECE